MLKLLVFIGSRILGRDFSREDPRADMYLPLWILTFGLVLIVGALVLGVYTALSLSVQTLAVALICLILGIGAVLCWKNQTVRMLPNDSFEYTTFLGRKTVYRFCDIRGLRKNRDSMTLLVGTGKVHMESCAVISERLADRINRQLAEIRKV